MNDLIELTKDELITIEGGNWIKDAGAKCKQAYCATKEALSDALEATKDFFVAWWNTETQSCC
jgi:hypothetical protein